MDSTILATIKEKLLSERDRLEHELHELGRHRTGTGTNEPEFPQFGNKEDENAAEVALFSDNLSLEENFERALRDVVKALERIERGDYGICKYCKKPINVNRLMARPESSSCVDCKQLLSK